MKGSSTNRKSEKKKNSVLKDVNFLEILKEKGKKFISIDNFEKENFLLGTSYLGKIRIQFEWSVLNKHGVKQIYVHSSQFSLV